MYLVKRKRGAELPLLGMERAKPAVRHNNRLALLEVIFILKKK
jgi:hypothetical protein